jgi:hypothetical protein
VRGACLAGRAVIVAACRPMVAAWCWERESDLILTGDVRPQLGQPVDEFALVIGGANAMMSFGAARLAFRAA